MMVGLLGAGSSAFAAPKAKQGGKAGEAQARFVPDANLERAQVPDGFKWNLAPLFESDASFEKAYGEARTALTRFAAFQGKLSEPALLRDCLELYFKERLSTHRMTLYTQLRVASDNRSASTRAMEDRALSAMNDFMAATSFIRQEVLKVEDAAMAAALAADPKLAAYKPWLDEVRRRKSRVLGAEAERVLGLAGDNLWAEIDLNELPSMHEKSYRALLSELALPKITDEEGKEVQLTLSNYGLYRGSKDARVRADTVNGVFAALDSYKKLFASTFAGQVETNIFYARAHGYETALEAYMDKDNISTAVYKNLVDAVNANLEPLHRYVSLRKERLGLTKVRTQDLYIPIIEGEQRAIPFDEARELLPASLKPMGPEYVKVLKEGLDPKNGWLDLYPNAGKESGASCTSMFAVHPFVKMNYLDTMDGLSTLAHEYGHALHTWLSNTNQPYVTSSYSMFVAEIASTFNEKMLSNHLIAKSKSAKEKLGLMNALVDRIRTTIYRQALFAEFELAAHTAAEQGKPLTADFLRATYGGLLKKYYGPDFAVEGNDDMEWAMVPHFYYKYYVYSYATGLSAALELAAQVEKKGAPARDAYLAMLKGGSSLPPIELLKRAGVDLTKPDAIASAARLMGDLLVKIDELDRRTAKR